jgi:hypothetical protein
LHLALWARKLTSVAEITMNFIVSYPICGSMLPLPAGPRGRIIRCRGRLCRDIRGRQSG